MPASAQECETGQVRYHAKMFWKALNADRVNFNLILCKADEKIIGIEKDLAFFPTSFCLGDG